MEGLLVQVSPLAESLCCVLEHRHFIRGVVLVQPRKTYSDLLKNCCLGHKESKQR